MVVCSIYRKYNYGTHALHYIRLQSICFFYIQCSEIVFKYLCTLRYLLLLAKGPPSAAFCSPFGGGRYNCIWDRHTDRHTYGTDIQTDAHTYGTDIQTDTPMGQTYRQTHMACEKQFLC